MLCVCFLLKFLDMSVPFFWGYLPYVSLLPLNDISDCHNASLTHAWLLVCKFDRL